MVWSFLVFPILMKELFYKCFLCLELAETCGCRQVSFKGRQTDRLLQAKQCSYVSAVCHKCSIGRVQHCTRNTDNIFTFIQCAQNTMKACRELYVHRIPERQPNCQKTAPCFISEKIVKASEETKHQCGFPVSSINQSIKSNQKWIEPTVDERSACCECCCSAATERHQIKNPTDKSGRAHASARSWCVCGWMPAGIKTHTAPCLKKILLTSIIHGSKLDVFFSVPHSRKYTLIEILKV